MQALLAAARSAENGEEGGKGSELREVLAETVTHWQDYLDAHNEVDARIASDATDSGPSWQEVYSWALWLLTKSRPKLHLQREKSGKQSPHQASRAQRASVVPLQARGQNMQDVEKYLKLAKTHIFRALYPGDGLDAGGRVAALLGACLEVLLLAV